MSRDAVKTRSYTDYLAICTSYFSSRKYLLQLGFGNSLTWLINSRRSQFYKCGVRRRRRRRRRIKTFKSVLVTWNLRSKEMEKILSHVDIPKLEPVGVGCDRIDASHWICFSIPKWNRITRCYVLVMWAKVTSVQWPINLQIWPRS